MSATLLIDPGAEGMPLHDVADKVFATIGVTEREERFSANYPPDDHYFAGYAANATVEVSDRDLAKFERYPFCVSIEKPFWRTGPSVIETDIVAIARRLAAEGLTIFVPRGAWYRLDWNGEGELYSAEGTAFGVP